MDSKMRWLKLFPLNSLKEVLILLAGIILGGILSVLIQSKSHKEFISYRVEAKEVSKILSRLESNGILYSYTVDHLKRHRIAPQASSEVYEELVGVSK